MQLGEDGRTTVEMKIKTEYNVPVNTLAKLVSTDLLGSKAIVFLLGDSKQYAENKDTLRADIQGSLAESLQPIQTKAENLMTKLDSSLASINKILNPNFQRNVDRSFASIANSLQTLEGTTKKIDALVGAQSGNLKVTTAGLNNVTANFQKFSGDLANGNIKQTLDNANKAVADLQATLANINSNKGSLGLLMNDDKLYKNLESTSYNMNELFIDLKANPKRYVHFSVFGGGNKKDK
jgi:phospholipid/cholesterol/gamma-HCH transport system substrate-binding protein